MIGDPKQAIYKFRGADVFTYINARRRVTQRSDGLFTLATNWRSSRAMVAAINQLFARAEQRMPRQGAFLYPRDIPFIPVAPAPDADQKALLVQGRAPAPLTFWYCRGDDKNGQLSSGQARQTLALQCAEEIVALLNASCDDQASVAGEALTPGNIAVLVRDRQEASAVKAALAQRGVNSVFLSRESVFDAPIAIELYHILQAVMQPADERKVRTALATPLLGASLQDIARLDTDLNAMQQVLDEFAHYHMHWQRFGVLSMLRQLMARREIPARLLAHAEGQRQLTDLRHLGELLQQASMARAGMHDLLRWYVRNCSTDSREPSETQRVRLESDSQLVQIVTIHSSKGLEFDIVFLPLASVAKHSAQCIYHRQEAGSFVAVADLAATPEAMALADHERLAEDLRVLYVALTRARYKCYVGLANIKASGPVLPFRDSAMAHLLDLRVAQDETQLLAGLQSTVTALGTDALELRLLPRDISFACTAVRWPTGSDTVLAPAELPDLARDDWYLTSYTALARGSMTAVALAGAVDEQDRVVSEDQAAAAQGSIFSFPRGPRYGTLLHNILEKIPFDCDAAILLPVVRSELQRFGVAVDEWTEVLAHWLLRVLAEPLPPLAGLCLQSLPAAARISEMEFTFSLANTVEAVELDALLRQHGYLGNSPPLSFADVTGVMRGFIDLVFEYGGRYFLLDYKSNFLGPEPGSYAAAALAPTMSAHRYDLQYLIYCVALHRYLGGRLPGYAVERHFGGVFYLFLRGMGTGGGPGNGVFFATPPRALIESLDSCFGHGACP
jgi:exodeoxyribonuclease V beta subunit